MHELLPEEADLYLQDSCHLQLPPSWQLVSVCIIGRSSQDDRCVLASSIIKGGWMGCCCSPHDDCTILVALCHVIHILPSALLYPVTFVALLPHFLSRLSLVTSITLSYLSSVTLSPSTSRRSDAPPSGLLQPMPCIPTDSVWEFFSHTAYYNQRLQWVEEMKGDDHCGGIQMKQPRLTRVSIIAQHNHTSSFP